MLYSLLKIPARIAFPFYCRKLKINHPEFLNEEGPLLIAANHPNSFLDAIVLATLFKRPIYSLVRGDVYSNNFYSRILYSLKMLPVYRLSEGAENLSSNYETFEKCKEIFREGGIVLIFSEGRCVNEWKLRPLRKGTARLALSAWEEGIPLRVLPVGINFSSFRSFGKIIHLHSGKSFGSEVLAEEKDGKAISLFNAHLTKELKENVYDINQEDRVRRKKIFALPLSVAGRIITFIPAAAGWIIAAPLFYPLKFLTQRKWNNGHFDSIMVAGLFLGFPVYILLLTILLFLLVSSPWALLLPLAALIALRCLLLNVSCLGK